VHAENSESESALEHGDLDGDPVVVRSPGEALRSGSKRGATARAMETVQMLHLHLSASTLPHAVNRISPEMITNTNTRHHSFCGLTRLNGIYTLWGSGTCRGKSNSPSEECSRSDWSNVRWFYLD
jgi:hypothetical protein